MVRISNIFIFIIFLFSNLFAQDVKLTAEISNNNFQIGSWIDVYVKAETNNKIDTIGPAIKDSIGPFEILKVERQIEKPEWMIRLTTIDTGKLFIPPIEFVYKLNGDTTRQKVYTNSLLVSVASINIDPAGDIKDVKSPKYAPWLFEDFIPYIVVIIILIAIVLGYYYYRKKKMSKKDFLAEVKIEIPPHKEALSALYMLEQKKLWQQGKVKEYYSEVTEIIRRFFEKRWNIIALEMTSNEILEQMKNIPEALKIWKEMESFFLVADLVKFAKYLPSPAENTEEMNIAYRIVKEMTPKIEISSANEEAKKEVVENVG